MIQKTIVLFVGGNEHEQVSHPYWIGAVNRTQYSKTGELKKSQESGFSALRGVQL